MSRHAWAYIASVVLAGVLLSASALSTPVPLHSQWLTFATLTALATLAQLFEAQAPGRQSYYPHLVFFFAGVLLLHPALFVFLVMIPHLIEWGKKRLENSPLLRAWYIQPFNIAVHITAGSAAHWVYTVLDPGRATLLTPVAVMAGITAALSYVLCNHLLIGQVLVLARGVSWRESGVLATENLATDMILLLLGYTVAVLWTLNPTLILPALSPLILIYRALMIPQLKQEARTDDKTGLWNARHFVRLFESEVERAARFQRPLALIMADLDLLRNINNSYGHLAGDAVLAGIGQIIRDITREYDIAARFGGEEFAIALPETRPVEACAVAERLRQAVEAARFEVSTSPTPIHATVSLGVACFPGDATTSIDLIHEADVAVYQAKLKGRNCVVAASDIPHFIRLETAVAEDRLTAPYTSTYVPRPQPAADGSASHAGAPARPDGKLPGTAPTSSGSAGSAKASTRYPRVLLWLFVSGVIVAGAGLTILALAHQPQPDLRATALLVLLATVAELLHVELYKHGSISVSITLVFAAALLVGIPGVAMVSAAIALAHSLRRQPPMYKTGFNWAAHILAGSVPALTTGFLTPPLQVSSLPLLVLVTALTAPAYYIIETGLIATAISLSEGTDLANTWRERFHWLAGHYLVLSFMGSFLAIAYAALGILGVLVFVLPVLMMRYAQKQYVERTEDSVQELERMNQELTRANREVVAASQAIRRLNDELFLTLSKIIDARDPYVHGHAAKVAEYATAIAMELNLPVERVERVRQTAFLHDIGKLGISERVLHKPDKLTDEEYEYVKGHVTLGAEFLETSHYLQRLAPFVRHHHEWWDGRGYPDGLQREQIPLEARILAVCDAVEAMASDRPYHRAMPLNEILAELRRCAGTQFDPAVVEAFVRVIKRRGDGLVTNSAREVVRQQVESRKPMRYGNGWFLDQEATVSRTRISP